MKKIFSILCVGLLLSFGAAAQATEGYKVMTNPNALALDSVSGGAAAEGPVVTIKGRAKTFSIVLSTTKISGTIAGTVSWQGSTDNVKFWTISTTALADASTVYGYKEVDKAFPYYRALITSTGTNQLSYSATTYTTVQP